MAVTVMRYLSGATCMPPHFVFCGLVDVRMPLHRALWEALRYIPVREISLGALSNEWDPLRDSWSALIYTQRRNITNDMTSSLNRSSFWILTALAGQRRHGYEILQETAAASNGQVSLKVTTLYAALERLEREGLIRADGEEIVKGRARRYYRLTDDGVVALTDEVDALEAQAAIARGRLSAQRRAISVRKVVLA